MMKILMLSFILFVFSCSPSSSTADQKSATEDVWTEEEITASQVAQVGTEVALEAANLDQDARNDAELFLNGGDGCGSRPGCGKWEYVRNKSTSRRIEVTIKTSWRYNNENRTKTEVVPLAAAQEKFLGCTAWCGTGVPRQDFNREIIGASYL